MQRLLDRDNDQRREEQKYNELKRRQGKKDGKLPPEPKTDIVNLPPSVSITMLMKRADAPVVKYGVPKTLFMFADELSTITQSNKRAFADLKQIMKTAYDLGSFYGQDYLSEASYSTVVDVMLNSLNYNDSVVDNQADILCLSALLTTTMTYLTDVLQALEKAGIRDKVKVMVGGAPVSHEFAEDIGADGYSSNANEAVALAKRLMSEMK